MILEDLLDHLLEKRKPGTIPNKLYAVDFNFFLRAIKLFFHPLKEVSEAFHLVLHCLLVLCKRHGVAEVLSRHDRVFHNPVRNLLAQTLTQFLSGVLNARHRLWVTIDVLLVPLMEDFG